MCNLCSSKFKKYSYVHSLLPELGIIRLMNASTLWSSGKNWFTKKSSSTSAPTTPSGLGAWPQLRGAGWRPATTQKSMATTRSWPLRPRLAAGELLPIRGHHEEAASKCIWAFHHYYLEDSCVLTSIIHTTLIITQYFVFFSSVKKGDDFCIIIKYFICVLSYYYIIYTNYYSFLGSPSDMMTHPLNYYATRKKYQYYYHHPSNY